MKLAIMQPYFFPYVGYFSLINQSDQFILFDTPQYIRHGWIDRNRILKPNGEPLYIKVPLIKHNRDTTINNLIINNTENWTEKIFAQLVPYKKKAPNYWKVISLLKDIFKDKTQSMVELNYNSLKKTCEYLEISTPITIWSEMNVKIDKVNAPDEWALNICKALDADVYYNPTGGISFFNKDKYKNAGIKLEFLEVMPTSYQQLSNTFIPFLSIIDVLMFNSISEVNNMLDNYKLL
jgi:hypothetical protein